MGSKQDYKSEKYLLDEIEFSRNVEAEDRIEDLIREQEEQEIEDNSILHRYTLKSYPMQKEIKTLIEWMDDKVIVTPKFQRDYVWKADKSSKFIDTILLNLPVPNIVLFKKINENIRSGPSETYLLIDGLQRLETLKRYVKGENWKTDKNGGKGVMSKISYKLSPWHNKRFVDLTKEDQKFINQTSINATVFESNTDAFPHEALFEIFGRINMGSEMLSSQEVREAISSGWFLDRVIEESHQNYEFTQLVSGCKDDFFKRKSDREFLLRLITYLYIFQRLDKANDRLIDRKSEIKYNTKILPSKRLMLNDFTTLANLYHIPEYIAIQMINDVAQAMTVVFNHLGPTAFKNFRISKKGEAQIGKNVHEVFAEALVIAVVINDFKINISKADFHDWKLSLWENPAQLKAMFVDASTSPQKILKRTRYMLSVINGMEFDKTKPKN